MPHGMPGGVKHAHLLASASCNSLSVVEERRMFGHEGAVARWSVRRGHLGHRVRVHDCSFDTTQQAILKTWLLRRRRHSSWPRSMRSRDHRFATPLLRPWSKHSRRAAVLRAHDQGVILQKYASQVRVRSIQGDVGYLSGWTRPASGNVASVRIPSARSRSLLLTACFVADVQASINPCLTE
jgi:hypothetical protein